MDPALDFATIYRDWYGAVLRWVSAFGASAADREDLAQEVFIVVQRRLPFFDGTNLAGWLYRIARRRTRDYRELVWVRDIRRGGQLPLDELPASEGSALEILESKEQRQQLAAQFARLGDRERAALVWFELEGHACEEIARRQSVALGTVWARIHHARRKLRVAVRTPVPKKEARAFG